MVRVVLWRISAFDSEVEEVKVDCFGAAGAGIRDNVGSDDEATNQAQVSTAHYCLRTENTYVLL